LVWALRMAVAVIPAIFVLVLTLIISLVSGHPGGLFLARSLRGVGMRFIIATLALALPVLLLPKLIALVSSMTTNQTIFGQLVKAPLSVNRELNISVGWTLRPVQGISLSLIVAERFLSFLEFSIGASYSFIVTRLSLFVIGGALSSLFLSTVWALDDLGVQLYNGKTGEINMAGSSIGTILPLITGAIGVAGLFHTNLPIEALIDLSQIVLVLYPPYVLFTVIHHEFVKRRRPELTDRLVMKTIETKVL